MASPFETPDLLSEPHNTISLHGGLVNWETQYKRVCGHWKSRRVSGSPTQGSKAEISCLMIKSLILNTHVPATVPLFAGHNHVHQLAPNHNVHSRGSPMYWVSQCTKNRIPASNIVSIYISKLLIMIACILAF